MTTSLSTGNLRDALARLGREPAVRERLIAFLRDLEPSLLRDGVNVREEITGPIVDGLFLEGELIRRQLSTGVTISFPYRSKIARDFVMAPGVPGHVWEPQTTKLLLALGQGAKNVVIGGAYFGDQAIPLAHAIRPFGGVCHCFEVNPEQLKVLADNAAQNGLTNVVINPCGLWDRDARRLVMIGDDSHAYAQEAVGHEDDAFPTLSIDTYAADRGLEQIDLIMLDIEGAELAALRGAERFLRQPAGRAPNIVFEVHRSYVDWSDGLGNAPIVKHLTGHGYRVFAVRDYQSNVEMDNRPIELVPVEDIYLEGPPHGFNMLAVKSEEVLSRNGMHVVPGVSPKLLFHRDPRFHQPRH